MRKHITRDECDSVDEVCALFREFFQELQQARVEIETLKDRCDKLSSKGKKKGGE